MFGIRTALFLGTVVGIFALGALIGSVVDLKTLAAVVSGLVPAGGAFMILALRRQLGLWAAGRA